MACGLLRDEIVVRSRHWRYRLNSSWNIESSPDHLVWTDVRTLRRARLARWRWLAVLTTMTVLTAVAALWAATGR
jgi:hypothetical protein